MGRGAKALSQHCGKDCSVGGRRPILGYGVAQSNCSLWRTGPGCCLVDILSPLDSLAVSGGLDDLGQIQCQGLSCWTFNQVDAVICGRSRLTNSCLFAGGAFPEQSCLIRSCFVRVNFRYQGPGLPAGFRQPFQVHALLRSRLIQVIGMALQIFQQTREVIPDVDVSG